MSIAVGADKLPIASAGAAPHDAVAPIMIARRHHWLLAMVLLALGVVGVVATGSALLPARAWDVFKAFVVFGSIAGLVLAAVTWRLGKEASLSGRLATTLMVLLGAATATGGALLLVNKLADDSPGVTHRLPIAKKTIGADSRSYNSGRRRYVSVGSWLDDDGKLVEVQVEDRDRWERMQIGDPIDVVAHDGRLGWPWVEPCKNP